MKDKLKNSPEEKKIRKSRKEFINRTKDDVLKINRAKHKIEGECIICGKKIKKSQAFRALPNDKNCQEERLYHLRTCGPGSENWRYSKPMARRLLCERVK